MQLAYLPRPCQLRLGLVEGCIVFLGPLRLLHAGVHAALVLLKVQLLTSVPRP